MKNRWYCERCGQDDANLLYYYYKPYERVLCAHCVIDMVLRSGKYSPDMSATEVLRALELVEVEKYFRERDNAEKEESK